MRRRAALLLGVAVVCVLLVTSCSGAEPSTPPGRFAEDVDLAGQTFAVSGKEFAEQIVLCKMTIALLQSARATVVDACDTTGSGAVRAGLTAGRFDMYWEYTGTAWRTYLGQDTPLSDPDQLFAAVRDADNANDVAWLDRTPFDDTYAIGSAPTPLSVSASGRCPTWPPSHGAGPSRRRCASTRSSPAARTGCRACSRPTASTSTPARSSPAGSTTSTRRSRTGATACSARSSRPTVA